MADREGVLAFDDVHKKATFQNITSDRFDEQIKFEAPYDSVVKVVFDSTTHMRGEGKLAILNLTGFWGLYAAAAIGQSSVRDNWLYLEYKDGDHVEPVLLILPNDCLPNVQQRATNLFGGRVVVTAFPEHGEEIPPEQLQSAEFKSKYTLKLNKTDHPLPTEKPDKATIIVVCPMVGLGLFHDIRARLHANDRVVAVNEMGTYSFAYLDPGKYRFILQSRENDNGFETELEAGKTYYFLQNSVHGDQTMLSRNSGEVVTYLAEDAYFSDWKPK